MKTIRIPLQPIQITLARTGEVTSLVGATLADPRIKATTYVDQLTLGC